MKTTWQILTILVLGLGVTVALGDDWPQWRGPNRDDISKEKGLLQQWPKGGPKLLWKYQDAGIGFSAMSIVGDVMYTMGSRNEEEYAIAVEIKGGQPPRQLWATKVGPIFIDNTNSCGDGPRSSPTVDGEHVYCLGGHGELVCLKRDKGEVVWRKNLVKDFKGEVMSFIPPGNWGYCESPLVDGDKLICCPGGPGGWMMALNKKDGSKIWRTEGVKDQATDSSIVIAEFGGVRQYINSSFKGNDGAAMMGVAAADGKILWNATFKDWDCYAICSTPIVHKDKKLGDLVYASVGYSKGCCLLQITKDGAGFSAKDLYEGKAKRNMQNEHGGVVLVDGNLFGYSDGVGWVCQDLTSGAVKWKEKRELDGKGSLTYADGNLYLLSDEGEAALVKATAEGWQEKGRFTLPELSKVRQTRETCQGAKVWTHPVLANGRLFLRDQEFIYCYQVK